MLIYSQDRKCVYNVENMTSIYIGSHVSDGEVICSDIDISLSGDSGLLGRYETEERAIEVLEDILYHFKQQYQDIVYEMPEK